MRRNNEVAQIVFHCVQIGDSGRPDLPARDEPDGTLEALARLSGGQYVRRTR